MGAVDGRNSLIDRSTVGGYGAPLPV